MPRRILPISLLALLWILSSGHHIQGNVRGGTGGNGQPARPFYIVAHNPNTLSEAAEALDSGANALGPDVMRFPDSAVYDTSGTLNSKAGPSGLYMYHDHVFVTTRMPDTLESYLDRLHQLVKQGKNLALIVFDVKPQTAAFFDADGGARLRRAVATHLNYDGVIVDIIYSVGTIADSNLFMDDMCLGPNEGLMIDGENDPVAVINALQGHVTTASTRAGANCGGNALPYNIAFGNGSFGVSSGFAPNVLPSIAEASWVRAGQPNIGNIAIPYAFNIELEAAMHEYITAGADGLIADYDIQPQIWAGTLEKLAELAAIVTGRSDVYVATAADDPFAQPNQAYGLRIDTVDESGAGTNANLTFKLMGTCGTAQVTVDASYQKLFESGNRNHVTIQSKNLGLLQRLEVSSDGSCSIFSDATWNPGAVQISSARWGIPSSDNRTVDFGGPDVCAGSAAVVDLGNWGRECDSVAPVASPSQAPAANSEGWNNSTVTVMWNWVDNASGSGIDPASCSTSSQSSGEGILTLTSTCRDLDGNVATASHIVKVDSTLPTVACGAADGLWHAADASILCTASDAGSGLASASDASFSLLTSVSSGTENADAFTNSRVVFDAAGNSRTAGPVGGNRVDKKRPAVVCGTADGLWHATDVSIACSASDGGSGLMSAPDANFSLSTSVAAGTENANAFTGSRTVLDPVGNAAGAGPIGPNKVDKKPPTITISQPAAAEYVHSATLTLNYVVTDGGSDVATVTPRMDGSPTVAGSGLANGQSINLLTAMVLGQHTFTINAADNVGNSAPTASVTFTIIVTAESVMAAVDQLLAGGAIKAEAGPSLLAKLNSAAALRSAGQCAAAANVYAAFISEVKAQKKSISAAAAAILIADAQYLIAHCP